MANRKLVLVLGGARSGKSAFAQRLAVAGGAPVLFLATAEPGDAEMADRISRHRAERPANWRTIEETRHLGAALEQTEPAPVTLVDCVTLWVTNLLLEPQADFGIANAELENLLNWYDSHDSEMILVSNEVGLGIVPADPLSRLYRDWLGWFNQRLAERADEVYWMVAGLAVNVKALSIPI